MAKYEVFRGSSRLSATEVSAGWTRKPGVIEADSCGITQSGVLVFYGESNVMNGPIAACRDWDWFQRVSD